jgi:hypothetical protein
MHNSAPEESHLMPVSPDYCNANSDKAVWKLKLKSAGMFSNVNEVVEQLRLAQNRDYRFVIDWSDSCYYDPSRGGNPWEYYFMQCFPEVVAANTCRLPLLLGGTPIACSRENIITPRLDDGNCNPLLLPADRDGAHALIERYIRLKPHVQQGIDEFMRRCFRPRMVGLHIRGPGRTDGGVPELRRRYSDNGDVPLDPFFRHADQSLRLLPEAGIFACSDSSRVIEAIVSRYGERVVCWPAIRSEFGEMHASHPANEGITFSPYELGLDVLSEAILLSKTDIFVHGNSNVANFVLCFAPLIIHSYVRA